MSRQVQKLLVLLQLACLSLVSCTMLPLELYEIAHSHRQSDSISLHDLLVAEDHFQERTHPLTRALVAQQQHPLEEVAASSSPGRRHRKSTSGTPRRRSSRAGPHHHRQGRQMVSRESGHSGAAVALSEEPKIYYAVGASSEADLPICAPHAVCSKVDVYDVPYIERQCVCPQQSSGAPHIYQYNMDSNRAATLQKHLENIQRSRPQRILDLTYNVRNVPEETYIKELMLKLSSNYDVPEFVFNTDGDDNGDHLDTHGGRLLRKRKKVTPGHLSLNNAIGEKQAFALKKRHNSKPGIPKIGGCSAMIGRGDGHTIVDKTRQYKLCEPVNRLEECENFGHTWSVKTNFKTNVTQQEVFCRCKKNSVTYLTKREELPNGEGYAFLFNCAPQNDIRCQRKEPCQLFSVRQRDDVQEVNTHPLCKCPRQHSCPHHHTEAGVIGSTNYTKDNVTTYTAYCMADES